MQKIGDYAFFGCTALEKLSLPSSLTEIGDCAFKGDGNLKSVVLSKNLTNVGKYAFYGCNFLTIYIDKDAVPSTWNTVWNVSFCTVVWDCVTFEGAVLNFSGDASSFENIIAVNEMSAPYRPGYIFVGWSRTEDGEAEVSIGELSAAADGTTFYAVWAEQVNN